MRNTKYEMIAAELESGIKNKIYAGKIPSVRNLAKQYQVSTRTITKALKVLQDEKIIFANDRSANFIRQYNSRPKTGVVAIFCNSEVPDITNDPLLRELNLRAEADGYIPLFMNTPGSSNLPDEKFWSMNWVDGYIFAYSTIKQDLLSKLDKNKVPFVVANRLPDECSAHWVDFNIEKSFTLSLEAMVKAGRRKIMFFHSKQSLACFTQFLKNCWRNIAKKYPQALAPDYYIDAVGSEEIAKICAQKGVSLGVDGFVLIGVDPPALESNLGQAGLKINEDYSMFYRSIFAKAPDESFARVIPQYKKLADASWELFKAVCEQPGMEPRQILIDDEINLKPIIRKEKAYDETGQQLVFAEQI